MFCKDGWKLFGSFFVISLVVFSFSDTAPKLLRGGLTGFATSDPSSISLSSEGGSFKVDLVSGWNLVSVPFKDAKVSLSSGCDGLWAIHYNAEKEDWDGWVWIDSGTTAEQLKHGQGYYVYFDSEFYEYDIAACSLSFTGSDKVEVNNLGDSQDGHLLGEGKINHLGSGYDDINLEENKGDCKFVDLKSSVENSVLKKGNAYFVEVEKDCQLKKNEDKEDKGTEPILTVKFKKGSDKNIKIEINKNKIPFSGSDIIVDVKPETLSSLEIDQDSESSLSLIYPLSPKSKCSMISDFISLESKIIIKEGDYSFENMEYNYEINLLLKNNQLQDIPAFITIISGGEEIPFYYSESTESKEQSRLSKKFPKSEETSLKMYVKESQIKENKFTIRIYENYYADSEDNLEASSELSASSLKESEPINEEYCVILELNDLRINAQFPEVKTTDKTYSGTDTGSYIDSRGIWHKLESERDESVKESYSYSEDPKKIITANYDKFCTLTWIQNTKTVKKNPPNELAYYSFSNAGSWQKNKVSTELSGYSSSDIFRSYSFGSHIYDFREFKDSSVLLLTDSLYETTSTSETEYKGVYTTGHDTKYCTVDFMDTKNKRIYDYFKTSGANYKTNSENNERYKNKLVFIKNQNGAVSSNVLYELPQQTQKQNCNHEYIRSPYKSEGSCTPGLEIFSLYGRFIDTKDGKLIVYYSINHGYQKEVEDFYIVSEDGSSWSSPISIGAADKLYIQHHLAGKNDKLYFIGIKRDDADASCGNNCEQYMLTYDHGVLSDMTSLNIKGSYSAIKQAVVDDNDFLHLLISEGSSSNLVYEKLKLEDMSVVSKLKLNDLEIKTDTYTIQENSILLLDFENNPHIIAMDKDTSMLNLLSSFGNNKWIKTQILKSDKDRFAVSVDKKRFDKNNGFNIIIKEYTYTYPYPTKVYFSKVKWPELDSSSSSSSNSLTGNAVGNGITGNAVAEGTCNWVGSKPQHLFEVTKVDQSRGVPFIYVATKETSKFSTENGCVIKCNKAGNNFFPQLLGLTRGFEGVYHTGTLMQQGRVEVDGKIMPYDGPYFNFGKQDPTKGVSIISGFKTGGFVYGPSFNVYPTENPANSGKYDACVKLENNPAQPIAMGTWGGTGSDVAMGGYGGSGSDYS